MSVRYPTSSIESRFEQVGLVAADAGSSRLVYAMVIALIVIGVVLIVVAVVVFRRTRVDPDVLAPLERMGSRRWRKGDAESRRQLLDAVRPTGATAPSPADPDAPVGLPPPVIDSAGEPPHEATFVAGPDGVEPVEHVGEPEPVEGLEPAEAPEPIAAEPVQAAEAVEAAEPVEVEPVAAEAGTAPDDPVTAADDVAVAPDGTVADPDADRDAPDVSLDEDDTSTGDVVDAPVGPPIEPIDGSVAGQ